MHGDALLDTLAEQYRELEELERAHARETGAGSLLGALLVSVAAGLAAVPLALVPALEPGRYWWLMLVGAPVLAAVWWGAWLVLRRLTAGHGPVGAEYRTVLARRDATVAELAALPRPRLGPDDAEGRWQRLAALDEEIRVRAAPPAGSTGWDVGRQARAAVFRKFPWALFGAAVLLVTLPLLAIALLYLFAEGQPAAVLLALPVGAAAFTVLRICALKVELYRRGSRTVREGWRLRQAVLRRQLTDGEAARPDQFAGVWSHYLAASVRAGPLGRGRRSTVTDPARRLRGLPADAPRWRRWYWRRVGPGGLTMVLVVLGSYGVIMLLTYALPLLFGGGGGGG